MNYLMRDEAVVACQPHKLDVIGANPIPAIAFPLPEKYSSIPAESSRRHNNHCR